MPRHVGIVFVHGILGNEFDFAAKMEHRLRQAMPRALQDFIHFRSVFWAGTVREHQRDYFGRASNTGFMWHKRLRRYVIEGLGDAAAYQKTRYRKNSVYYEVQSAISDKIATLETRGREQMPLIFIGHSLGCHVISSYLWDINKLTQRSEAGVADFDDPDEQALWRELKAASPLRRMKTLAGIVTLGSNMPMFTFTFGPDAVYPVTSPISSAMARSARRHFPERLAGAFEGKGAVAELLQQGRSARLSSEGAQRRISQRREDTRHLRIVGIAVVHSLSLVSESAYAILDQRRGA